VFNEARRFVKDRIKEVFGFDVEVKTLSLPELEVNYMLLPMICAPR